MRGCGVTEIVVHALSPRESERVIRVEPSHIPLRMKVFCWFCGLTVEVTESLVGSEATSVYPPLPEVTVTVIEF